MQNQNPKVTVLMPVYNCESFLKEAINSILDQTFKDFEFLIINDGSTDKTGEILKSYNDPRIKIINNKKNIGLTKSLNKGLRVAKGEYIARQDADDISLPLRLEKEVEILEKDHKVGLVGIRYEVIDEAGKSFGIVKYPTTDKEIKRLLMRENPFGHGSVMLRKEYIENIGFYRTEFKYVQDLDFFLRISEKCEVVNISEPLYKFRISPNSLKKKVEQDRYAALARELAKERRKFGKDKLQIGNKTEIDKILKKIHSISWIERRKVLARTYYSWGYRLFYKGDYRRARMWILKSFFYNAFNVNTWIILTLTFLSPSMVDIIRKIKAIARKGLR